MRHTKIIAEAGVNHNGNLVVAKELIDAAYAVGADYIKFQTYTTGKIVSHTARKAIYQTKNTGSDDSQMNMLKRLELSTGAFIQLHAYCQSQGIAFFSTAFDNDSVNFLHQLDLGLWKIPSGEITNLPYLIKIAAYHQPVLMSTGMSTMQEVDEAVKVLRSNGCNDITLLHCTTEYPAPFDDVNLKAMISMRDHFQLPVGYSDHTMGIEVPIAAVALGATVIEKHLTLDRTMDGPDHKASLEPQEFADMVKAIRHIEAAMGDGLKQPSMSEMNNILVARKSIVANRTINKGEKFTAENLAVKRPGSGISPMRWYEILGLASDRDYQEDEEILWPTV